MKLAIAVAITFAALIGKPAFAADMAVKTPPPPPAPIYNWGGFYVGANIGGGWADQHAIVSPNDPIASDFGPRVAADGGNFNSTPSFNTSGVLGGLQLGYNWQFKRDWLIGWETDFDWANVRGSSLTTTGGGFSNAESFGEQLKSFGTVRGRLGYLPSENLLTFVTGGLAYGRVERTANINTLGPAAVGLSQGPGFSWNCIVGSTCFTGSSTNTALGWTIGGGLEYALRSNLTIKAEYLYVSLPSQSVTMMATAVLNPGLDTPSTFNVGGRTDFNVARVGVNYRF
jgi:outer membrane immunogenic protein